MSFLSITIFAVVIVLSIGCDINNFSSSEVVEVVFEIFHDV